MGTEDGYEQHMEMLQMKMGKAQETLQKQPQHFVSDFPVLRAIKLIPPGLDGILRSTRSKYELYIIICGSKIQMIL